MAESYDRTHTSRFENKLASSPPSFIFHNVSTWLDQHLHTSRRRLSQNK